MKGPLTIAAVRECVADIQASVGDPERAHGMESELFAAVLRAVSEGHPHSAEIAKAALAALDLDFPRWCA